ncbi:MAG: S9 family peptidase, partial [Planctomycetota bacterium]
MKYLQIVVTAAFVWVVFSCGCRQLSQAEVQTGGFTYPQARNDSVVDVYHGTEVPDPYRWLEDADAKETQSWVAKQNELTSDFLSTVPVRNKIEARLKKLMNYPRYSAP